MMIAGHIITSNYLLSPPAMCPCMKCSASPHSMANAEPCVSGRVQKNIISPRHCLLIVSTSSPDQLAHTRPPRILRLDLACRLLFVCTAPPLYIIGAGL